MHTKLRQLRTQTDDRWACILFWLEQGGRESLRKFCISRSNGDSVSAEDVELATIAELYSDRSRASEDAFATAMEGNTAKLEGLAIRIASHAASPASHRNRSEARARMTVPLDDRYSEVPAEFVDPLESMEQHRLSFLLRDCLANALTDQEREEFLMHDAAGYTFSQIGRERGCSDEAVRKRHKQSLNKIRLYSKGANLGDHCPSTGETIAAVLAGDEVTEPQLLAMRAHVQHCAACSQVVADGRRSLREAALFFPFPLALGSIGSGGVLEAAKGAWASFTTRTSDLAGTVVSHPAVQTSKPIATGGAIAALLLGGGTYKVIHDAGAEKKKPPVVKKAATPAPVRPTPPATKKPKKAKKKSRKAKKATPAPAPAPAPVPQQTPSTETQSSVDDGSSEFSPEGR